MIRHLVQNGLQSEELEILDGDRGILEVSLCFLQKVSTHGSAPFQMGFSLEAVSSNFL